MAVPSSIYRTCRTGWSLNVVIFTMEPFVEKKKAGAAPNGAAPAVSKQKRQSGFHARPAFLDDSTHRYRSIKKSVHCSLDECS
jgi:hypothetical protein